ncbi:MAG: hypothetical protein J6W64_04180 [Bacilli bacterium]|nr:hypothetical protein [Bacilli bacterium]
MAEFVDGAITGILFSDLFITDKAFFVKFFSSYYEENQKIMDSVIAQLQTVLSKTNTNIVTKAIATEFQQAWKNFERIVLLNDRDLQLLVAYRGEYGTAEFSTIVDQEYVEGVGQTKRGRQYGIQTGKLYGTDLMAAAQAREVEEYLQAHLNDFLHQLEDSISLDEARNIHDYHEYCLLSFLQNTDIHITGSSWINAFYTGSFDSGEGKGSYYGGQGVGKAYDAFMNHMANKERGIFDYLQSGGMTTTADKMTFDKTSVYIEEQGVEPSGTFAELLAASRNSIGWYTGGDIVIVNPQTMEIVYNIQLKTTGKGVLGIFTEKIAAIRTFLNGFLELTPQQKGEKIFDFFMTSISNSDEFNNMPSKTINGVIQDTLMKKYPDIILHP